MELTEAMAEEYGHSKKWFKRTHVANLALLTLALAVLLTGDHVALGIAAFVVPLFLFFTRFEYTHHYEIAEKMRRLLLLMDSLGVEPSQAELAQFWAETGRGRVKTVAFVRPYYDSKRPIGFNRLAENVGESAYFTKYLSRAAAATFALFSCLGIILVVLLLVTVSWLKIEAGDLYSRVFVTTAVFFSTGDFCWIALQFFRLHSSCHTILTRAGKMNDENDIRPEDAYRLMQDYNCALIQALPIPEFFYGKRIGKLNRAWRQGGKGQG